MDKLGKHIKETLEKRNIAPSKSAWDEITSRVNEPSPRKRNTWLPYAIAASVAGIVLVSVFFFAKGDSEVEQIQIVDTETEKETLIHPEAKELQDVIIEEQTEIVQTKSEPITSEKTEEFSSKTSNSTSSIAEQDIKQPLQDKVKLNSDKLIAQKVEEVVAHVTLMESAQQDVSDAEVDSLLRAAQRQILTEKLFTNGSVDAKSLLAEVEGELDNSFRDQIFDALKTGYFKLRTAVADRNQ
ncbi:hypothetical protein [Allomuricauda sp. F6463D]|uniref:hypothetical protein n=1 Tax=Allomuricauda sp. F6463D TaxID=2926409 RepID=UPI001FF55D48|nr:hypothetical protein [Muricauda sp. F6463D]MCK0161799.1 hypothetical protein [Muricauda sp. F6463D]